ncbi:MAG: hypothetical protein KY433_11050, partial [Actinobacteria bacterium]|nr:hypothetical protein [Actinomycetota bacterium]
SAWAGITAFGVGVAGAFIVAAVLRRRPAAGWVLAVTASAVVVAVGGGTVGFAGEPAAIALDVPDVVGLALRAAAVGVVARARAVPAVAAAIVLGVGESLLRSQGSLGEAAVVPALAVLAWGLWATNRTPAVQPA